MQAFYIFEQQTGIYIIEILLENAKGFIDKILKE